VTIPLKAVPNLPKTIFSSESKSLVVIDTGNYYPQHRDGRIDAIEGGTAESRWVEQQIGHPVIKAFNNILAAHLQNNGKPAGSFGRIALPIAGDDPRAKQTVMRLIDEIGFDAVDAGTIDESWRQQPGSPVYAKDYDAAGVRRALGEAKKERVPEFRAR
jgi:predicted dinucleotide-binding enzyme